MASWKIVSLLGKKEYIFKQNSSPAAAEDYMFSFKMEKIKKKLFRRFAKAYSREESKIEIGKRYYYKKQRLFPTKKISISNTTQ